MTPPEHLQDLFEQVVNLPPDQRSAYLDEKCNDNPALRAEIEALISGDRHGVEFMNTPPRVHKVTLQTASDNSNWQLEPGKRLGHYEIQKMIGSGGMGAVYQAVDLRLLRTVAIKI